MKKCPKCGVEANDEMLFCPECGESLEAGAAAPANNDAAPALAGNKKIIAAGIAALVAVILVIVGLFSCGPNTTKKEVVREYYKLVEKDSKEYIKDLKKAAQIKGPIAQEEYEEAKDEMKGFKQSIKFAGSKEILGEDFDFLKKKYEEVGKKVKKAYEMTVKVTTKSKEHDKETRTEKVIVVKVGGNWYVDSVRYSME